VIPVRLTAILNDGQRVTREVDSVPGCAGRPMERADVDRKFRGNVSSRWPQVRTDSVLRAPTMSPSCWEGFPYRQIR